MELFRKEFPRMARLREEAAISGCGDATNWRDAFDT